MKRMIVLLVLLAVVMWFGPVAWADSFSIGGGPLKGHSETDHVCSVDPGAHLRLDFEVDEILGDLPISFGVRYMHSIWTENNHETKRKRDVHTEMGYAYSKLRMDISKLFDADDEKLQLYGLVGAGTDFSGDCGCGLSFLFEGGLETRLYQNPKPDGLFESISLETGVWAAPDLQKDYWAGATAALRFNF